MSAPIRAYVGFNGGGKTLAMVHYDAVPALQVGREVWANLTIGHELAHVYDSWRDLVVIEHGTVLLDEATAALPSRQAMSLPPQLARTLNQLRKSDVSFSWTAPNWARMDKIVREVTQTVTTCRGFLPDRWVRDSTGRRVSDPEKEHGYLHAPADWKHNRLFRFTTYAADDFDEFTLNQSRKLKPVRRRWYWRPSHVAHTLYRTLDPVELLDHLDDVGQCVVCGGSRRRPSCTCEPRESRPAVRRIAESDRRTADEVHEAD